jgi:hypothetical protein
MEQERRSLKFSKMGKDGAQESISVRQASKEKRHATWIEQARKKHDRNPALKPWAIAEMISEAYVEQGRAKSYHQRTVFEVIKKLDCFQAKKY